MQIDTKNPIFLISLAIILVMVLIYDKNTKLAEVSQKLSTLQSSLNPIIQEHEEKVILAKHNKEKETNKADELAQIKAQMQQQFEDFQKQQAQLKENLETKLAQAQSKPLPKVETTFQQPISPEQQAQINRTNSKLKIINNATVMGVITYVNMDFNLVNLELKKPEYVKSGDVLTIRRKGNLLGKITVATIDGNRASADVEPKMLKAPISIGDELIFY